MTRGNGEGSVYRRVSDGKWVASWTEHTPEGKRRRVAYFATQKPAKDRLRAAMRRTEDGLPTVDSSMPLAAWVEQWQSTTLALEGLKVNTQRVYRDVMRLHVVPVIGALPLREVRATHVEMVLSRMADTGLSASYRHQAHKALSKCLAVAVRDRLIPRSPVADVRAPRGGHRERVVPDRGQVLALLEAAPDARMRTFVAVLAYTGLRISEALAVRWADVDIDRDTIRVVDGKGGKSRAVPISAGLHAELVAWRKAQAAERLAAVWWDGDADWMLSSEVGTRWEAHNARKRFRRMAAKACPGVTPHSLRHATATMLLEEGVPLRVVSDLLGHSSIKITADTYSHVTARLTAEAASALDRALGSSL